MGPAQAAPVYLVSCVSKKMSRPAPARDLYISDWFLKAREFVESREGHWYILSAEHGLVHPDQVISPYERTLNAMPAAARKAWAERVLLQLDKEQLDVERFVVLAGSLYRQYLVAPLRKRAASVDVPMEGLAIGKQLAWLKARSGAVGSDADPLKDEERNRPPPPPLSRRLQDLIRFYEIIDRLAAIQGGGRLLSECDARLAWPRRGVYFFLDGMEPRLQTGAGVRVVRVGTHAVSSKSQATLWRRLSQHRGTTKGLGNHRGSIFRLLAGEALLAKHGHAVPSWGAGGSLGEAERRLGIPRHHLSAREAPIEAQVSAALGSLRILVLPVDDEPGPASQRAFIERNAIALLSNFRRPPLNPPSPSWLGLNSLREKVRDSGLWNQDHVDLPHDPSFLDTLATLVENS